MGFSCGLPAWGCSATARQPRLRPHGTGRSNRCPVLRTNARNSPANATTRAAAGKKAAGPRPCAAGPSPPVAPAGHAPALVACLLSNPFLHLSFPFFPRDPLRENTAGAFRTFRNAPVLDYPSPTARRRGRVATTCLSGVLPWVTATSCRGYLGSTHIQGDSQWVDVDGRMTENYADGEGGGARGGGEIINLSDEPRAKRGNAESEA